MRLYGFICIVIFSSLAHIDKAQVKINRKDLEKEKQQNLQKIKETTQILEETRSKKTATLGQLNVLTQQIIEKNRLIQTYEKEIHVLDLEIQEVLKSISAKEQLLMQLREEYAHMIYAAYKTQISNDKLIFLFSAKTFQEFSMRLKYFTQYSQERQKQVGHIKKVADQLVAQSQVLKSKKQEKTAVLIAILNETNNLSQLKSTQENIVKALSSQEAQLTQELEERKKAVQRLETLITELIRKEMERAAAEEAARRAAEAAKKSKTPESNVVVLGSDFAKAKSNLIWPVQYGFISSRFGKQPHPVLRNVTVENLGVDIQTKKDEKVRAVFDGTVMAVQEVVGMNTIVMLQHPGGFYTFYAKLSKSYVKQGQKVKAKDLLGEVYSGEDGTAELQFQVWKNSEKQDPEDWLSKR